MIIKQSYIKKRKVTKIKHNASNKKQHRLKFKNKRIIFPWRNRQKANIYNFAKCIRVWGIIKRTNFVKNGFIVAGAKFWGHLNSQNQGFLKIYIRNKLHAGITKKNLTQVQVIGL